MKIFFIISESNIKEDYDSYRFGSSKLYLKEVHPQHFARYKCTVSNTLGEDSIYFTLEGKNYFFSISKSIGIY